MASLQATADGRLILSQRRLTVLLSALAMAVFLAYGCGNDDGPSTGNTATCADACARCPMPQLCSDCAGWSTRLRDEFEGPLYACVVREADAGCPRDWERCIDEAIGVAGDRDIDRTFRDACLARRTECQNQMMGFADDDCVASGAFLDSAVTDAQTCIVKPCAEVQACLSEAFRGDRPLPRADHHAPS
ncbi:MAG TPA: hypothetical protein VK540_30585 [Polyangiaceae bacterium]|nr:hypothetical protein [Polyangiaceae bacterium]